MANIEAKLNGGRDFVDVLTAGAEGADVFKLKIRVGWFEEYDQYLAWIKYKPLRR